MNESNICEKVENIYITKIIHMDHLKKYLFREFPKMVMIFIILLRNEKGLVYISMERR